MTAPITDAEAVASASAATSAASGRGYMVGLEEALTAYAAEQTRLAKKAIGNPDGDLTLPGDVVIPGIEQAAKPWRQKFDAISAQARAGQLTRRGQAEQEAVLRAGLAAELEKVFAPAEQRLTKARGEHERALAGAQPSAEDEAAAVAFVASLTHLTPAHGLPRIAQALREAVTTGEVGAVRAALPYLKSALEAQGTAWYGNPMLAELVLGCEAAARSWQSVLASRRIEQLNHVVWQLSGLRRAALETDGRLEDDLSFRSVDNAGNPVYGGRRA